MDLSQLLHSLKKVQGKKKRDAQLEEEKRQAALLLEGTETLPEQEAALPAEDEVQATDLLSSKDEDVIF